MTIISLSDYLMTPQLRKLLDDMQKQSGEGGVDGLGKTLENLCSTCGANLIYIHFSQLRVAYCSACRLRR